VLDERFPERVAAEPEVVARHADAAGLAATAVTYYQRAGKRARDRSAHERQSRSSGRRSRWWGRCPRVPSAMRARRACRWRSG
jgi:hypothetical protein